jgi:hypothetical protein
VPIHTANQDNGKLSVVSSLEAPIQSKNHNANNTRKELNTIAITPSAFVHLPCDRQKYLETGITKE